MHKIQMIILYKLRHAESARFSELMRDTGLESDTFKFHLRKLVTLGYVQKLVNGQYTLSPIGKEFANNLDDAARDIQKHPKVSVLLVITRTNPASHQVEHLFQQRQRNPYYGFWGNITGSVPWGESFEATAERELKKQTGLAASFNVKSFYRKTDYDKESKAIFEDKLFVILEASAVQGELDHTWPHGINRWMTVEELCQQEKYFTSSHDIISIINSGNVYTAKKANHDAREY